MAGISNIVGAYNINPKRISSKLSFEIGQVFTAKIVATSELNQDLILRLLDGWQFPAKLQKPLDFVPDGLVKLEVEGFQDGKLQIKLVNTSKEDDKLDKSSIEDLLLQGKIGVDKDDYDILKNMIKHNMPLTKDNVSKVKTIFDFRDKLLKDEGEEESFTLKYINSKGIEPESTEGKQIKENLMGFFKELKNISEDEILTMFENNIDLTENNIKSFIKVSMGTSTIYKELNNLTKQIDVELEPETIDVKNVLSKIKESPNFKEEIVEVLVGLEQKLESASLNPKELELYEGLKKISQDNTNEDKHLGDTSNLDKPVKQDEEDSLEFINPKTIEIKKDENDDKGNIKIIEDKNTVDKDTEDKANVDKNTVNKNIENKISPKNNRNILSFSKRELEGLVKEQLSGKTEEMKNIIKTLLDKIDKPKPEIYDKVIQGLKDNINDFKVFNSISNQYYYLDVPLNLNKKDYNCKLLIKDDRKTGKKIDSKNVSMVVSVKTGGIGTVDAYIKVKERNMSVNIKCEESWIKLLSSGKNKIMNELNRLGYTSFLMVEKRESEANLTNCREFFDDNSLNSINVKV
jgi:hypothetical protein